MTRKVSRRAFLGAVSVAGATGLAGCASNTNAPTLDAAIPLLQDSTLITSPSCSCCHEYADLLANEGVEVNVFRTDEFTKPKEQVGLPKERWSCHTIDTGEYLIEGHVPFEAVEQLATERPDVRGIGLAGMPAGSPGMGGQKTDEFVVYAIDSDGATSDFMRV